MEIYNKYGATSIDISDRLYPVEKEVYSIFVKAFPDATLPELRILFAEFMMGLQCRFSEDLLGKAIRMKKEEKK